MFAPVRSVMASPCNMGDSVPVSEETSLSDVHALHDMSSMMASATVDYQSAKGQHKCCAESSTDVCANHCDMGVSVSLLIQSTTYAPLFINVAEAENISAAAIVRELTPPSRPPANFS